MLVGGTYLSPAGEVGEHTGEFSRRMHNSLQATRNGRTTWSENEATLVFPVSSDFKTGALTYLNTPLCEVAVTGDVQ